MTGRLTAALIGIAGREIIRSVADAITRVRHVVVGCIGDETNGRTARGERATAEPPPRAHPRRNSSTDVRKGNHPRYARRYARRAPCYDAKGAVHHRIELLEGLRGSIVEIGAGCGLNFAHYPSTVRDVVAIEPDPYLRRIGSQVLRRTDMPIVLRDGLADALPLDDSSVDAGVASLVLCSVPDPRAALAELRRVIRPGGELRFYEHVRSLQPAKATAQRMLDLAWPYFAGGCHTARRTVSVIEASGFAVDRRRDFEFRPSLTGWPASPHVVGLARRTA